MIDTAELSERVSALPEAQRRAFAAAVATRQVVSLERVADKKFNIADRLWQGIASPKATGRDIWARRIALLPRMIPECGGTRPCSSFIGQAIASLGYAMLCRLSCDSGDAVRAAICAVKSAELAETHLAHCQNEGTCSIEACPLTSGVAERELQHQRSDLDYLTLGWLDEIRWNSYARPMLTEREAVALSSAA